MGDFFHGRMRKIALLLLATALLVFGIWMRSYHTCDEIDLSSPNAIFYLATVPDGLTCARGIPSANNPGRYAGEWWVRSGTRGYVPDYTDFSTLLDWRPTVQWKFGGFVLILGDIRPNGPHGMHAMALLIPYWSIIIPPTLLSAFLLLRKTRVAKLKIVRQN